MKYIDKADAKILKILRENARTPLKTIAQEVFLSAPTVAARIDAMEKKGIIRGYRALVSESILGHPVKAFINLEFSPDRKTEVFSFLQKSPEAIECCHVTGEYSLLIEALVESTDVLDRFVGRLQKFGRTKTQIVFSTVVHHRGFEIPEE